MAVQREKPGPGQESVWDYPRPPRLEPVPERITVELDGKVSLYMHACMRACTQLMAWLCPISTSICKPA